MKDRITPKQLARALDVSESTIKRWCDKGIIPTEYTAGGHRRITMAGVLEFLRRGKYELHHPAALGLPPTSGQSTRVVTRGLEQMTQALLEGDEATCRQIVFDLYLAEHSISSILDEVIAAAFRQIGDRWACGEAEIFQERRGCEIALRLLVELRNILPRPDHNAPLAIGGTISGDYYELGTTMAELVLRESQWRAVSLGTNLPFETLAAAIRTHRPRLFWLSCSHIVDEPAFLEGYSELHDEFSLEVAFVVGGTALTEKRRQEMQYAAYCDTMQHLEGFAQSLHGAMQPKSAP